jgi:hypothetical protein
MAIIRFPFEFPRDLGRSLGEIFNPQTSLEDRRERFVAQVKLPDARLRAYTGNDPAPGNCQTTECLHVSSDGKTIEGKWEFDVRQSLCYEVATFGEPSIVASPVLNNLVITSVGYFLSEYNRQLILRVSTMKTDGSLVDAYFHWHAIIPYYSRPLI